MGSILAQLGALLTKKMSNKAQHMRGLEEVLDGMPVPAVSKARSEWFNVHQVRIGRRTCRCMRGWYSGELARVWARGYEVRLS